MAKKQIVANRSIGENPGRSEPPRRTRISVALPKSALGCLDHIQTEVNSKAGEILLPNRYAALEYAVNRVLDLAITTGAGIPNAPTEARDRFFSLDLVGEDGEEAKLLLTPAPKNKDEPTENVSFFRSSRFENQTSVLKNLYNLKSREDIYDQIAVAGATLIDVESQGFKVVPPNEEDLLPRDKTCNIELVGA